MPGTITFRPIEANLTHNTDFLKKMSPYCAFIAGTQRFNSQICKHGGKHPVWNDAVTVPVTNQSSITLELMDKDKITKDDQIGFAKIDLFELQNAGSKWYPLYHKNKPAGEILLEASFQGDLGFGQAGLSGQQTGLYGQQTGISGQQTGLYSQNQQVLAGGWSERSREEQILASQPGYVQQEKFAGHVEGARTFVEQRQSVEPHTFLKEVDVVETRPVLQNIEVMEPQKVIKEVQYTQAVPVKRQIETVEPQVVRKQVEVMEPRLVTKTIQVIENIPVTKEVEVIESVPRIQEVETFEPQTFTKQIEVTEQVPVTRQVTVTEPVHLKKAVEFVEPIITTQTITKEIRPEVIVNQEVTTSVGPATYVGEIRELSQKFSQITLSESERSRYLAMTEQQRLGLSEEERWRWHEARRLSGGGYNYGGNVDMIGANQFTSGNYSNKFNLSDQDILRYSKMNEKDRLALQGDELLRWQEAQRLSGISGGSGYNYSTSGSQFNYSSTGNQFNLSEKDRLRYLAMTEKERLTLKGDELLRWQEAKRLSGDPAFSQSYAQQGLGGEKLSYGGSNLNTYNQRF